MYEFSIFGLDFLCRSGSWKFLLIILFEYVWIWFPESISAGRCETKKLYVARLEFCMTQQFWFVWCKKLLFGECQKSMFLFEETVSKHIGIFFAPCRGDWFDECSLYDAGVSVVWVRFSMSKWIDLEDSFKSFRCNMFTFDFLKVSVPGVAKRKSYTVPRNGPCVEKLYFFVKKK